MSSTRSSVSIKAKVFLLFGVLLLAGGIAYWLRLSGSAEGGKSAGGISQAMMASKVPVSVVRVEQGTFTEQIKSLGTVTAWNKVDITSQVSGTLERVHFQEGQRVEQGELLAEIDPRTYQAELLQAEGALAEVRAQLNNARLDLERYQQLREQDSIAQQTLDHQRATLAQLEGTLKVRQGQRDAAQLNLEYSRITAPISGRLGLRQVDIGNHISIGNTVLVTLTQQQPVAVSFTITEHEIPAVQRAHDAGQLRVQAWSRDESMLLGEGVLDSVDNQVDVATGTLRMKGRFANETEQLFVQQFVNVTLFVAEHEQVMMLPNDAIQFGSQGSFVWRVREDNKVDMVPVRIGLSNVRKSVIEGQLQPGESVVLEGVDRLKVGAAVEVVRARSEELSGTSGSAQSEPASPR